MQFLATRRGVGHPVFVKGIDTHLTQSTRKVTLFEQKKQVIRSNSNPRSGIRAAISPRQEPNVLLTQVAAAMDSCFWLIRPHRHTHVA